VQDPREDAVRRSDDPVHTITTAADARSSDLDARINRYLVSMGIRTVCFVLALVVPGPMRWVFVAGAVLLPYVAVIAANAPSSRRGSGPTRPDLRAKPIDGLVGTLPPEPPADIRSPGGGSHSNG
jgi:hypothetical protein